MSLESLKKRAQELYDNKHSAPRIIIEPDTSLTLEYDKVKTWNLPKSFLAFRGYQQKVHNAIFNDGVRFVYLAWCRRLGKEVTSWSALIKYCLLRKCTGVIVYPNSKMGARILWEGKMSNKERGESLDFLDFLPPIVDRNRDINDTVKRIDLPNGSQVWLLGAENYDSLRGINPQIAVFSEYAFQDPRAYNAIRPIVAENNGVLIVQTTFDGHDHGFKLYDKIRTQKEWYTSFLTAETAIDEKGKRYITEDEIQLMRDEGQKEHYIQQEFYMKVDGDADRYLFAETLTKMEQRKAFENVTWLPNTPVFSFWDIGIEDSNAISLVQFKDGKPIIVAYFETNNATFEYEIGLITAWRISRNLALGKHYLPHDGKNRLKNTPGAKPKNSVQYIVEVLGEPCDAVDRPKTVIEGTKKVRALLPSCSIDLSPQSFQYQESSIDTSCLRLKECLQQHKKEWCDKTERYLNAGIHDWTSHGVKSIQTMAIALETKNLTNKAHKVGSYRR